MKLPEYSKNIPSGKYDFVAVGIFFLYCVAFAVSRLLISSTMELDESEQFLNGSVFQWGYNSQAPLYSWIVKGVSSIFGLNIVTLLAIKYGLLFLFYCSFYSLARSLWDSRKALIATGSLMLFPLYVYEFNRDLSHTILMTLIAAITCLFSLKILSKKTTMRYILLGFCIGMGTLSKYNFLLFAMAVILAGLSMREGRRIIFDKRIGLSLLSCMIIVLPHFIWLLTDDFSSVRYALEKAQTGGLETPSLSKMFFTIVSPYSGLSVFLIIFLLFFYHLLSTDTGKENPQLRFFKWVAAYGLLMPILIILALRAGHFSGRWLAPIFLTVPIVGFSMIDLNVKDIRIKYFTYLCAFLAIAGLTTRIFIGFMPDNTGKAERIHIPFKAISIQLQDMLRKNGIFDVRDIAIISDDIHLAANSMALLPGTKFVSLEKAIEDKTVNSGIRHQGGVILLNIAKPGKIKADNIMKAFPSSIPFLSKNQYLHSQKLPPYVLWVAIVPMQMALR